MRRRLPRSRRIKPGGLYEDCGYHPCVCIEATRLRWPRGWRARLPFVMDIDLVGISLLDASRKGCSARHCAPVKMTVWQVAQARDAWERNEKDRAAGHWVPDWPAWQGLSGPDHPSHDNDHGL